MKFADVAASRELLEILYMVPPMYHINRSSWANRKARILAHLAFWAPLHRELATAPLASFEYLSEDRMLQRTSFQTPKGNVSITVNFGEHSQKKFPPLSASVAGAIAETNLVFYQAQRF